MLSTITVSNLFLIYSEGECTKKKRFTKKGRRLLEKHVRVGSHNLFDLVHVVIPQTMVEFIKYPAWRLSLEQPSRIQTFLEIVDVVTRCLCLRKPKCKKEAIVYRYPYSRKHIHDISRRKRLFVEQAETSICRSPGGSRRKRLLVMQADVCVHRIHDGVRQYLLLLWVVFFFSGWRSSFVGKLH